MEEEKKEEVLEAKDIELDNVESEKIQENSIKESKKGISIAGMVLGICSIVFASKFIISVACGVLAIVFGVKGKNGCNPKMAKAGFITGIIGLAWQALAFLVGIILGAALAGSLMAF